MTFRDRPRSVVLAAVATTLAALLALGPGVPAPGLPALFGRVETLTGLPLLGLARITAVGVIAAWAARLRAGLGRLDARNETRVLLLGALVVPATLPGASVAGLIPALVLSGALARRSGCGDDRRVALLMAAAVLAALVDPRLAPAGAIAIGAAARRLLGALDQTAANDNAPPAFSWRVASSHLQRHHLQGSWPQFISE